MGIQYISDSKGKTTGVYIPIEEWNALKGKFHELENAAGGIPDWQMDVVRERIKKYKENPSGLIPFDKGMDDIEDNL